MKTTPKKPKPKRWPQAHFLIERYDVAKALAEFENDSASTCIYISSEDSDEMAGLHLSDGELELHIVRCGERMKLTLVVPKGIPASQCEAMTPPCFQTVETFDKGGTKLGGEAYRWKI